MTKKLLLFVAVAGLAASVMMPASAAHIQGVVNTACTTTLPDFPNQNNTKSPDDCDGNPAPPTPAGGPLDHALGAIRTSTGVFVAGGPNATKVSFSYNENCVGQPSGVFPLSGAANGNFLVEGTFNGSAARFVAGFTWSRTGLIATISFVNTVAGHNLENGTIIPAGLYGIDTNNNLANGVEVSFAGVSASALGLLQPRGGAGGNACPDLPGDQWETVTAHTVAAFGSTS